MKKTNSLLIIAVLICIILPACKKSDNSSGLSSKITSIISVDMINNLKQRGMTIHEGTTPPNNLTNIYYVTPYTLLSPWGVYDNWAQGKVIEDYKYHFYNQLGDEIELDCKNIDNTDVQTGLGTYISGSGNMFTIFAQVQAITSGIPNKQVLVISGEITPYGIKNFEEALIVTQKTGDDYNSVLIPVGSGRIWYDKDGISETTLYY